ncbi:MAG: cation:proton antiporter family protein [Pseudomonadota bacterium]
MEFIWILFAFICGLGASLVSLPPLIGYLIAGFALNFAGFEQSDNLQGLSNLGITLMLFTIGLKLNVKSLLQTSVWGGASINMLVYIFAVMGLMLLGGYLGVTAGLTVESIAIIAFALSFSSTVCIVKILEEQGELKSRHGKIAIGILVIQDIVAVAFMVIATGQLPNQWAIGLLGLFLLRKPIGLLLEKVGHGELLPLLGFFLAFGGYELFYLTGIKGDLGALLVGALLSNHAKASELYKSLMSFKDLFLIGFFLSIGFTALPSIHMVVTALALTLLIPIKTILFFLSFNLLKLPLRTGFLSAILLSNFSEFGLIVAVVCIDSGWLSKEWLVILALSTSFSFVLTSLLSNHLHTLYRRYKNVLMRLEIMTIKQSQTLTLPTDAKVLIIGMGRVGKGSYHSLCQLSDEKVWGIESDEARVQKLRDAGYRVLAGDAEDVDLWNQINLSNVKLVLIALPYVQDIKNIREQLEHAQYQGKIAAIARYQDEIEHLVEYNIDRVFNLYTEAGVGFAEESYALIQKN